MHWPHRATAEDVAEARRLYEATATSVETIRRQFGWTKNALRRLAKYENWTMRPPAARGGPMAGRKPIGPEMLVFKLNRLITYGIGILEEEAATRGVDEPGARKLTALCRAQEIMMRIERMKNAAIREKKNKDDGYDFRDDPIWLAAEFARRTFGLAGADAGGAAGVVRDVERGSEADASR